MQNTIMWKKLKQQLWQWRGVLITAPSVTGLLIALRFLGLLQPLDLAAFDLFFRLRPLEPADPRIVVVGITETDIRKVGKWPIPDTVLAKLLNKLKQQQPAAIGLDVYRDLPVEPGHQELVKVFESTPNLIGIQFGVGNSKAESVAPPPVLSKLGQVSANDMPLDADGSIRRGFLYLTPSDDSAISSLGLKLALIYLQKKGIVEQAAKVNPDYLQLGKAVFVPFESNDGGYVRADAGGYQILLNFRGPREHFRTVSMTDILEDKVPKDWARDRIVLIGTTATSVKDAYNTPYGNRIVGLPEKTPGVEIHANLISQILSEALSGRVQIRPVPHLLAGLWIFGWSLVGATLSWKWRYAGGVTNFSPWKASSMVLAGGSLFVVSYLLFLGGWWIPVVPPLLALSGSAIAIAGYIAITATYIRQTFSRYLTDEVVANLLETPEGLKLGGERRKVTILMSDLRGFSAVSERLSPEKVVAFLNIYLGAMTEVITKYNGTIDEFIGDAILVIFGAPNQREDDAQRAVACAVAMQLAMDSVNAQIEKLGIHKLEMGIGINTGEVVVGNIGSQKRAKYGVVGSQVNVTGRIESYTVGGQILVSEFTRIDAGSIFVINRQIEIEAKGIKEPITLYDVRGITGKYNICLPDAEDNFYPLHEPIPLKYLLLDGKYVVGNSYQGSLIKLSAKRAEIRLEEPVDVLINLKMNLLTAANEYSGDIFAKVVEKSPDSDTIFLIYFTAIPPDVEMVFQNLVSDKLG